MFKNILLISLLTLLSFFQGCSDDKANKEANSLIASNEFILTATDNKQFIVKKEADGFVLDNAKGKVVIFDIFATWCPPCRESATHLSSLKEKFGDDIVILGVTIEDDISNTDLEEFKKKYNAQYSLVNSSANRPLVNAITQSLKLGQRFPIPVMALYKDGKLVKHYVGAVQEEFVESDIKVALGK